LAGWLATRTTAPHSVSRLIVAASAWTLSEWLRGWLFSGFGWLSVGYAQVTGPLAGYSPIGGVLLPGLLLALTAAWLCDAAGSLGLHRRRLLASAGVLAIIWACGYALIRVDWSHPVGEPTTVSLVQGNVEQDVKFEPTYREKTFAIYADLVQQSRGRLIVLPESALPVFADEVPPEYVALLRSAAQRNGGDLLLGLFFFEPSENLREEGRYFNSVVTIGTAAAQVYRKHHLVPFGETIPLKPIFGWFINNAPSPIRRPGRRTRSRLPSRASGSRSISATKTRSATSSHRARKTRPCWSMSPTTPGTVNRWRRSSTIRSRPCARWKPRGRCCVRPTPASHRSSIITASSARACRGSRAACSKALSPAGRD
jgi:apolipoprotein N-acyltransferase